MIRFILNNAEQAVDLPPGMLLLDYIRYHKHLTGTKIGCREGDCGACTVLIGSVSGGELEYRSFTSCLTPLGNVHGRHVVTVEGLNTLALNPVQQAMADCSATQCGFCTPGFVVSLSGFCLGKKEPTKLNAMAAIDGNICRCTGYKSIERAAEAITALLQERKGKQPLAFAVDNSFVPFYFESIEERLVKLLLQPNGAFLKRGAAASFMGGGTDLYVQQHTMKAANICFMNTIAAAHKIEKHGNNCVLQPTVTVTDLMESDLFNHYFPSFAAMAKRVSSTPIRNMATLAGNFINASPIGDFTIFFLALDATVILSNGIKEREVPLRKLYKGYKQLDKQPEEYVTRITFGLPTANHLFHFEKVSKRTHLDIASVNSAISLQMRENKIEGCAISAGGVAPVPLYLQRTSAYAIGKEVTEQLVSALSQKAMEEISPVSDARGSSQYKRLLLQQLIKAHFISLFPQLQAGKIMQA